MTTYATTTSEATVDWRRRTPLLLVWAAAIGYVLVASYFSLRKHDAFLSGYDLATFDQELWLLAHGHEPLNTADGRLFWGEHFQLTIALLAPLYLVGAGATTLLALQSVTMAAVAPLLYVLGRIRGATPWLAALPAFLWLASPATLVANLADVHAIPLVAPVIVGSIIALERNRLVLFAGLALLACCAKEDVSLIYVMVGLVVMLEGRRRLGAAIGVAGLGIFVFATAVFMPAFSNAPAWYEKRFAGARGDSLTDVAGWMLRHPVDAATDLITGQNIAVVLVLLLSMGGLCLLAPRWMLLSLPALAHNLLSAYPPQHELATQYFVPVALSLAIAAAVGAHRLPTIAKVPRLALAACVLTAFIASLLGVREAWVGSQWTAAETASAGGPAMRRKAIALIPNGAVVTASPRLSAHLSSRREIYAMPLPFLGRAEFGADWSAAEMKRRAGRVQWVAIDTADRPNELSDAPEGLLPLLSGLDFRRVFSQGSILVFERNGRS